MTEKQQAQFDKMQCQPELVEGNNKQNNNISLSLSKAIHIAKTQTLFIWNITTTFI